MRTKNQEPRTKNQEPRQKKRAKTVFVLCSLFFVLSIYSPSLVTAAQWSGVDESVVEKVAKEHGREAQEPLINTDQGDLLLFVFLLAGTVGGFAAGYYWRMLTENQTKNKEPRTKNKDQKGRTKERGDYA